ncbi:MAG: AtpZ/AtpI family protein [Roseburia sp.]|nr:AtpZ/AtpI family protein [Roseburia sp.]
MKKDKPYDKSVYHSLILVTQLGMNMLVPIAMMCALGIFLDKKLQTGWITILLFFVGAIAGAQNVYRMVKRVYEMPEDKASRAETSEEDDGKRKRVDRHENH